MYGRHCIHVILLDQAGINHIFAIEQHIAPLNRAHMFKQGNIDSLFFWAAFRNYTSDFLCLPVDDTGQNQGQAATCLHHFVEIPFCHMTPFAIDYISGKRMKFINFEQPASNSAA